MTNTGVSTGPLRKQNEKFTETDPVVEMKKTKETGNATTRQHYEQRGK